MSYIEDNDIYVQVLVEMERLAESLAMGVCPDCGSKNVKKSKRGNLYCGALCWVEEES